MPLWIDFDYEGDVDGLSWDEQDALDQDQELIEELRTGESSHELDRELSSWDQDDELEQMP